MKNSLLLFVVLAAAAGPVFAQAPAGGPAPTTDQAPDRRAQRLAKELNLSADQQARLAPILQAQRQEMQGLRQRVDTEGRQPGMGRELKAAQGKYLDQIKAVLTPEQFTKFAQLQDQQRSQMRERRQGNATSPAQND